MHDTDDMRVGEESREDDDLRGVTVPMTPLDWSLAYELTGEKRRRGLVECVGVMTEEPGDRFDALRAKQERRVMFTRRTATDGKFSTSDSSSARLKSSTSCLECSLIDPECTDAFLLPSSSTEFRENDTDRRLNFLMPSDIRPFFKTERMHDTNSSSTAGTPKQDFRSEQGSCVFSTVDGRHMTLDGRTMVINFE